MRSKGTMSLRVETQAVAQPPAAEEDGVVARGVAHQPDIGQVGRQQPLGQPVMRSVEALVKAELGQFDLQGSTMPGRARSLSVIACEQVGKAGAGLRPAANVRKLVVQFHAVPSQRVLCRRGARVQVGKQDACPGQGDAGWTWGKFPAGPTSAAGRLRHQSARSPRSGRRTSGRHLARASRRGRRSPDVVRVRRRQG